MTMDMLDGVPLALDGVVDSRLAKHHDRFDRAGLKQSTLMLVNSCVGVHVASVEVCPSLE
jgi:hypothetical protein